jgi:hypothetical protein
MKPPTTPPSFKGNGFDCPFCGVHATQQWCEPPFVAEHVVRVPPSDRLAICRCLHCTKLSIWIDHIMVHPKAVAGEPPNPDLSEEIRRDFEEARRIASASPRGAAALLRLAVQKLCVDLGQSGNNINSDIAALVKQGLSPQIQQALDTVRVVGNNAVHPGALDLKDDAATVTKLFRVINIVAEVMITHPKHVAEMYASVVPPDAQAAIAKRDSKPT